MPLEGCSPSVSSSAKIFTPVNSAMIALAMKNPASTTNSLCARGALEAAGMSGDGFKEASGSATSGSAACSAVTASCSCATSLSEARRHARRDQRRLRRSMAPHRPAGTRQPGHKSRCMKRSSTCPACGPRAQPVRARECTGGQRHRGHPQVGKIGQAVAACQQFTQGLRSTQ